MNAYLHGENFLQPVEDIPTGKTIKTNKHIVGHSESGHNHVLTSSVDFDVVEDIAKQVFIEVHETAQLTHQKTFDIHETLEVLPGKYKVTHKTEYNPFTKVLERVFD